MEVEKFISAQDKILTLLKEKSEKFEVIKSAQEPLISRWQMFLGLIIPVQLQVVEEYGFAPDQTGLTLYNEQLMVLCEDNQKLLKQNKEKWTFLLKAAFGIDEYKEMTLVQAQALIRDIANAMISDEFLSEVDKFSESIDPAIALPQKRRELLSILFPLHMKVMKEHGFGGDNGYILAQRAIMDYYYDPFIKGQAALAQKVLFERAKLI